MSKQGDCRSTFERCEEHEAAALIALAVSLGYDACRDDDDEGVCVVIEAPSLEVVADTFKPSAEDPHAVKAAETYGVLLAEVTKEQREAAKRAAFAEAGGMSTLPPLPPLDTVGPMVNRGAR